MDRSQILLLGLPIWLFSWDVINLFATSSSSSSSSSSSPRPKPHEFQPPQHNPQVQPLKFPTQKSGGIEAIGIGSTININFCASCSYRGTAINMKNMLEAEFAGIHIILANYPPSLPKRLLSKVVPVVQFGVIGLIAAGEHIFPRLGFAVPPRWYYSLRANRFGSIASTWLFGNFIQNILQSSGAFEVYCNGELVFSKLMENRFPSEIELRDLVQKKLANARFVPGNGDIVWS